MGENSKINKIIQDMKNPYVLAKNNKRSVEGLGAINLK